MTQSHAALASFEPSVDQGISGAVIMGDVSNAPRRTAAEELKLLQDETQNAITLLRAARDKTSETPLVDLKAAFLHIDKALGHSQCLLIQTDTTEMMLHLSMQYFQAVLSDIPQISFLTSRMIDSFLEIKNALLETRVTLANKA